MSKPAPSVTHIRQMAFQMDRSPQSPRILTPPVFIYGLRLTSRITSAKKRCCLRCIQGTCVLTFAIRRAVRKTSRKPFSRSRITLRRATAESSCITNWEIKTLRCRILSRRCTFTRNTVIRPVWNKQGRRLAPWRYDHVFLKNRHPCLQGWSRENAHPILSGCMIDDTSWIGRFDRPGSRKIFFPAIEQFTDLIGILV
jgi:hypothetical protein